MRSDQHDTGVNSAGMNSAGAAARADNVTTADFASRGWQNLTTEDRFARVIEASPIALVLAAANGRIVLVNRLVERMFGYDRAELHGKPLELLLPERFRDGHLALRQQFLADMSPRLMGEGRQLFGLRKDDSEFPLEIGLNPIDLGPLNSGAINSGPGNPGPGNPGPLNSGPGNPGAEAMVLAGIADITARHAIEQEREQQRLDLVRSNADLEEFAYIASHDLKAPLRGIAQLVQWISEDNALTSGADTLENLKMLRARVTRMQMLLDGLLAYSRVGRERAAVEEVDIGDLVEDITAMLAPPPGFVIVCKSRMPVLRTHRAPIRAVLENLIGNAMKHHDRAEGRVTIAARMLEGMAEFRISDDGPGISPWFHDRIFMIFETLASREDVESSGIGLAIVKKKVESHGGQIRVESAPPARGSTFVFTWQEAAP
jgi:PAS domain S-box-containing protein